MRGGASYYVQPRALGGRVSPCRTRSEGTGGAWEVWERPYGDAAAQSRSVAPGASERAAGVPSLTVRAAGGLVGGVPVCLVVEPPSAASAGFP